MNDREALLAGILAHPEADLPRLVYADWLDEQSSTVPCPTCAGTGVAPSQYFTPISPGLDIRYRRSRYGRTTEQVITPPFSHKLPQCPACKGSRCIPSGTQEHAKFIRDQIAGNVATMPRSIIREFSNLIPGLVAISPTDGQMCLGGRGVELYFRRGFVAEVRAPMEWLVGGECGNCGGTGLFYYEQAAQCPDCGGVYESVSDPTDRGYSPGTGRTPGHLAEIVKTQPVQFVGVTDREPMVFGDGFVWWCVVNFPVDNFHSRANIPVEVFRFLQGGLMNNGGRFYHSREEAQKNLSDAILTRAKQPS